MKIKSKFSCLAPFIFLPLALSSTISTAADIVVSSSSSSTVNFDSNNQTVTIASGGNIAKTSGAAAIVSTNFTGLHLILNANSGQGLSHSGNESAVEISGGSVSEITLNSGRITSNENTYSGTINLSNVSAATINLEANTSIANSGSSNVVAIGFSSNVSGSTLNINNSGTISAENAVGGGAILIGGGLGSVINIVNDGGIINGSETSYAIFSDATSSGSTSIENKNGGEITSQIEFYRGSGTITNDATSTITSNIILGNDAASSITNSGEIYGDVTFSNSVQTFIINNGGSMEGSINGDGTVTIGDSSFISLNSGTLNSTINSISSTNRGSLLIAANQTVVANSNIGSISALQGVVLNDGAFLDFATNNKTGSFGFLAMNEDSRLDIGSAAINSNIYSNTTEGLGTVNFTQNNTLLGTVGVGGFLVSEINITAGKSVNAGSYDVAAHNITLGTGSTLSSDGRLDGAISLGNNAILNLGDGAIVAGSINGSADHQGVLNTEDDVAISSTIGNTHSLASFNIAADSQTTVTQNIKADETVFEGELILNKSGGNAITGNLSGDGTLDLASGSHTVSGNLALQSGSTIQLSISTPTTAGNIVAAGTASIANNTILVVSIPGSTARGSSYKIFSGASGSSITQVADNRIQVGGGSTNILGNLRFVTEVSGNDLFLNVTGVTAEGIAQNQSQSNVYTAIFDVSSASGNLLALQNYLNDSDNSNASKAKALESTSPQVDNSSNRVSFNTTNSSLNITSQRLSALRGISSGDNSTKKSAWAQAFGAAINQGNTGESQGYKAGSFGFAGGFDHEIRDDVIGGISFSYANSSIKSRDDLKKTNVNSYQVNLYASKDFENFFLNGLAGIALNRYSSNRAIPVASASARAKYWGQTYIARLEAGKNLKLENDYILTPSLAITAARNSIDDYNEKGAGNISLNVRNRDSNFFEARAGAEIGKNFTLKNGKKIHPAFFASYGYDLAGNKQHSSARFIGQSASFASSGGNIAQGSLKLGTSLKFFHDSFFSMNLDYAFEQRNDYNGHYGSLKAKYEF